MRHRIHITGAAGTGTTTLGARLAKALNLPHLDTDDVYWLPSDPPFTAKRPQAERIAMIREAQGEGGWVLSGSVTSWGTTLVDQADLIVFLSLATETRLDRLRARETALFGARTAPGGDMEHVTRGFLDWASHYDDPAFLGRSRAKHEYWLAELGRPVLRLASDKSPDTLMRAVLAHLDGKDAS